MFSRRLLVCTFIATNLVAVTANPQVFWRSTAPQFVPRANSYRPAVYTSNPYALTRSQSYGPQLVSPRFQTWSAPWYRTSPINSWYSYGARPQSYSLNMGMWSNRGAWNSRGPLASLFRSLTTPWNQVVAPVRTTYAYRPATINSYAFQNSQWNRRPAYGYYPVQRVQRFAPQYTQSYVFSPRPFDRVATTAPQWQRYEARWSPAVVQAPALVTTWQPNPTPWQPHMAFMPEPATAAAVVSHVPAQRDVAVQQNVPAQRPVIQSPRTVTPRRVESPQRPRAKMTVGTDSNPVDALPAMTSPLDKTTSNGFASRTRRVAQPITAAYPQRRPRVSSKVTSPRPTKPGYSRPVKMPSKQPSPVEAVIPKPTVLKPHTPPSKKLSPPARAAVAKPVIKTPVVKRSLPKTPEFKAPVVDKEPFVQPNPLAKKPVVVKKPVVRQPVVAAAVKKPVVTKKVEDEISSFERELGIGPETDTSNKQATGALHGVAAGWINTLHTKLGDARAWTIEKLPVSERFFALTDTWPNWWPAAALMGLMCLRWFLQFFFGKRLTKRLERDQGIGMDPSEFVVDSDNAEVPSSKSELAPEPVYDPYPKTESVETPEYEYAETVVETPEYFEPSMLKTASEDKNEVVSAIDANANSQIEPVEMETLQPTVEEFAAQRAEEQSANPDSYLAYLADSEAPTTTNTVNTESLFDDYVANLMKDGQPKDSDESQALNPTTKANDDVWDVPSEWDTSEPSTSEPSQSSEWDTSEPSTSEPSQSSEWDTSEPSTSEKSSEWDTTDAPIEETTEASASEIAEAPVAEAIEPLTSEPVVDSAADLGQALATEPIVPTSNDSASEPSAPSTTESSLPPVLESAPPVLEAKTSPASGASVPPVLKTGGTDTSPTIEPNVPSTVAETVATDTSEWKPFNVEASAELPSNDYTKTPIDSAPAVEIADAIESPTQPSIPDSSSTPTQTSVPTTTPTQANVPTTTPTQTSVPDTAPTLASVPASSTPTQVSAPVPTSPTLTSLPEAQISAAVTELSNAAAEAATPTEKPLTEPSVDTKTIQRENEALDNKTVTPTEARKTMPTPAATSQSTPAPAREPDSTVATEQAPAVSVPTSTPTNKQKTTTGRRKSRGLDAAADDLTEIHGLNVSALRILEKAGIDNFDDLSNKTIAELKTILENAGSRFCKVDPTTWPEQASLAAAGNWSELSIYRHQRS